jgi:hypothetical protein
LRKIARTAEREVDLFADATKKFMPLYGGRITTEVVKKASKLTEEAKEEAAIKGLSEVKSYEFRKVYIQNYSVS